MRMRTVAWCWQLSFCLQAAHIAMSHVGGKMVVCTTTMPNVGSARLKNRDNAAAYGTDREHTLRNPEDPFWCGGPSPHLTHTHIYSGR